MAFRSSSIQLTTALSPVVSAPAGIQDGDILTAWTLDDSGTGVTTWPSGFVEGASSPQTMPGSGFDASQFRYAIKVAASESGSYTLTTTTASCGGVICHSGRVQSTTPHRESGALSDTGHPSPWSIPSAAFSSATTIECDVIYLANSDGLTADAVHAPPSGYTLDSDFAGSLVHIQGMVAYADAVPAGETGVLTGTGTLAASSAAWSVFAIALPTAPPATTTFYLNNPVQGGSSAGLLDTTAPTASTSTTGWTVGSTVAARYSRTTYNAEVPATNFTTTVQPSGVPSTSAQDCYRLSGVTTGVFSAATWYSSVSVIAVTSGGVQNGRARFRLWKSANADGTSATEITQGAMIGSTITLLDTSQAQSSSASTQVGTLTLTNEFLFMQVAWETG